MAREERQLFPVLDEGEAGVVQEAVTMAVGSEAVA
jgi:hypothetical protein